MGRAAVLQEARVLSCAVPEPGPPAQGLWSLPCRVSAGLGGPSPAPAGHLQPVPCQCMRDGASAGRGVRGTGLGAAQRSHPRAAALPAAGAGPPGAAAECSPLFFPCDVRTVSLELLSIF